MPASAPESPLVIFLHMPKTGGTTFNRIIRSRYDADRLFALPDVILNEFGDDWKSVSASERRAFACDQFASLNARAHARLDAVLGHVEFGFHDLTDRPCTYVTFLRSPIERIVSAYNYALDHDTASARETQQFSAFSDFLDSDRIRGSFNLQTRRLTRTDTPSDERLSAALQHIDDHFLHVGLTETFDLDLLRITDKLDWDTPYYVRTNVSTKHVRVGDLPASDFHTLAAGNRDDILLYDCVRVRNRTAESDKNVRAFQIANRARAAAGRLKSALSPV